HTRYLVIRPQLSQKYLCIGAAGLGNRVATGLVSARHLGGPVLEPGPVRKAWGSMSLRCKIAVVLIGLAALAGCAETMPLAQLPDFYKLPEKVLSKDEQQTKVNGMVEK